MYRIKKYIILLIFICLSLASYSQEIKKYQIILKTHPLTLVSLDMPAIKGSCEFLINEKFGIEFGYGKRYLEQSPLFDYNLDTLTVNSNGNIKMLEFNWYDVLFNGYKNRNNISIHNYLGFSYRQINDLRNKIIDYWPENSNTLKTDCYAIKKEVYIFTFKLGFIASYKRLSIEMLGELGIRYKNQKMLNNEFSQSTSSFPDGLWFWDRDYKGILPNVNFSTRINYRIL